MHNLQMLPILNPDELKIKSLIERSELQAAKWLKDLETGDVWYWPADWVTHATMATILKIEDYDKGIVFD